MPVQQDKGRRSKQHTEKWICLSECCAPKAGLQPAGEVTGMRFCAIQSSALSSAAELAPVPFKSIQQKGEGWVILQEKSKTDQLRALVITSPLWPFHGHLSGPMGSPVAHRSRQLPQEQHWPQILFLGDLFITEFCLKPSSCRILARGLLQSTGTNSAVTLDTGLLHSVTFALMDDVPKHHLHEINAYEWVSTFHSQTKIMPRRRRNQQAHWGREVRGGSFSH